jgi:hypothetical protein
LTNANGVLEFSNNFCEKNNSIFLKKFTQIFENSITLAALLKLNPEDDKRIAELVISFIETEDILSWYRYEAVRMFIKRKAKNLNSETLLKFFYLTFSHSKLHESEIIETVLEKIADKGLTVSLESRDIYLFLERILEACKTCHSPHSKYQVVCLYKVLPEELRRLVENRIQQFLHQKFDTELFNLSVLFDLMPMEWVMFDTYIARSNQIAETRRVSLFGNDYMVSSINDLINLCFKQKIDLTDSKFDNIRRYSDYYEWLLNMDGFDYSRFNPEWTCQYPTLYYYREMSKSPNLIAALAEYLKENGNGQIEKILLKITHYVKYW